MTSETTPQYDEDALARTVTRTVVTGICVLIVSISSSCSYKATLRANMVTAGANPIDVACMESEGSSNTIVCMERARLR